jgi:hypothetical protein
MCQDSLLRTGIWPCITFLFDSLFFLFRIPSFLSSSFFTHTCFSRETPCSAMSLLLDTDLTNVLNGYRGPVKSMSYLRRGLESGQCVLAVNEDVGSFRGSSIRTSS